MTWGFNAQSMRLAALAVVVLILCLPVLLARGQQGNGHRSAPAQAQAPRYSAPQAQSSRPQSRPEPRYSSPQSQPYRPQSRPSPQSQPMTQRQAPGYPATTSRPSYPGSTTYARPAYPGPAYSSPTRPGYVYPGAETPGHLGSWLNQHKSLPVQEQERMLRTDPSFNRLPATDQQRLVQQLRQVDLLIARASKRRSARATVPACWLMARAAL